MSILYQSKSFEFERTITLAPSGDALIISERTPRETVQVVISRRELDMLREGIRVARDPFAVGRHRIGIIEAFKKQTAVFVDTTSSGNFLSFGVVIGDAPKYPIRFPQAEIPAVESAINALERNSKK